MNLKFVAPFILGFAFLLFLAVMAMSAGQLPDRMATHFDARGVANSWMDRSRYLLLFSAITIGVGLLVIGLCWSTRFLPAHYINIPHRAHWLSPENRSKTFGFIFLWGIQLAGLATLFFASFHLEIVQANSKIPPHLDSSPWIEAAVFILAASAGMIHLLFRFHRIPVR